MTLDLSPKMLALFLEAEAVFAGNVEADFPFQRLEHDRPRLRAEGRRLAAIRRKAAVTAEDFDKARTAVLRKPAPRARIWAVLGIEADFSGVLPCDPT